MSGKVPIVDSYTKIVACSKHLCGSATDMALRCLVNFENSSERKIRCGILIALCCHHRCEWQHYVGKELLTRYGFGEEEFYVLQRISSWATCNMPIKEDPIESLKGDPHQSSFQSFSSSLTVPQREDLGVKSKLIIDYGRSWYLQNIGYESNLVRYVEKETSPENIALLALHD